MTDRLAINQITVRSWSFEETVQGLARHGIGWLGAWLGPVQEYGVERAAKLLREHDVRVSSVCRAGFFTGKNPDGGGLDRAANERAVDLTAALGCDVLYLVAGGVRDDLDLLAFVELAKPVRHHRTGEFRAMFNESQKLLQYVFQTKSLVYTITGSGTAAARWYQVE